MAEQGKRLSAEAEQRYYRAMYSLRHARPIVVELSPTLANLLVAELQLALRHPQNNGVTADLIETFARSLSEKLYELRPELREVLELGWDPEYDQEQPSA